MYESKQKKKDPIAQLSIEVKSDYGRCPEVDIKGVKDQTGQAPEIDDEEEEM